MSYIKDIINELMKYQNKDFGFGKSLEPDVRLPDSSVVCTNMAVQIIDQIREQSLTEKLREKIVAYYESVYIEELGRWRMVDEKVDSYPRAIWWNYESVDSFTYGNPNPEIIGFLYQNMKYLKKINIIIHFLIFKFSLSISTNLIYEKIKFSLD